MNSTAPDFTDYEQGLVASLLRERYGKQVAVELADSELQLDPDSEDLTACPTLYWNERGAQFVVCKVGADRYRCQFFYSATEQYGTGRAEYDNLENCVVTLLQVQADHESQMSQVSAAAPRYVPGEQDYYDGPTLV